MDANADNTGENGEEDEDADTNGDTDDGIWSRELVVPTIVVTEPKAEPEMEMVGTRITPEEVERAIGARLLLAPRFSRRRRPALVVSASDLM